MGNVGCIKVNKSHSKKNTAISNAYICIYIYIYAQRSNGKYLTM